MLLPTVGVIGEGCCICKGDGTVACVCILGDWRIGGAGIDGIPYATGEVENRCPCGATDAVCVLIIVAGPLADADRFALGGLPGPRRGGTGAGASIFVGECVPLSSLGAGEGSPCLVVAAPACPSTDFLPLWLVVLEGREGTYGDS